MGRFEAKRKGDETVTNTIKVTIDVPAPPEGYEIWTGEGVPEGPSYVLSPNPLARKWYKSLSPEVTPLAYAVPIAKPRPKSREVWVNAYPDCASSWETRKGAIEANGIGKIGLQRITLYEGRFDQEGVPTPEERLIEAVGEWIDYLKEPLPGSTRYKSVYDAYKAIQEMKGE
jgi:hypothetical protein